MKKADIGTFQELQANGLIANSWMRKAATWAFVFWIAFTAYSCASYEYHFYIYSQLLMIKPESPLSQQSYITLISQLEMVNWTIFAFFGLAVFAPKALQKFAEAKVGIKTSVESESSSSTKTIIE